MLKQGDYIYYADSGVCRIDTIGTLDFVDNEEPYYSMSVLHSPFHEQLYVKVSSGADRIRPLLNETQAQQLIDQIDRIPSIPGVTERNKERLYQNMIAEGNCKNCLKVIRTINRRNHERKSRGLSPLSAEQKYLSKATALASEELSHVLDVAYEHMEKWLGEILC